MSFHRKQWLGLLAAAAAATGYGAPIAAGLLGAGEAGAVGAEALAPVAANALDTVIPNALPAAVDAASDAGLAGTTQGAAVTPQMLQSPGLLSQSLPPQSYTPKGIGDLLTNPLTNAYSGNFMQSASNLAGSNPMLSNASSSLAGPGGAKLGAQLGANMMQPPPRPQAAPLRMPQQQQDFAPINPYSAPTTAQPDMTAMLSKLTPQQLAELKQRLGIR